MVLFILSNINLVSLIFLSHASIFIAILIDFFPYCLLF